jgi:hypothetical protein
MQRKPRSAASRVSTGMRRSMLKLEFKARWMSKRGVPASASGPRGSARARSSNSGNSPDRAGPRRDTKVTPMRATLPSSPTGDLTLGR